ncbi:hypothetical protein CEQ90_02195 [Lewinellaceae bacterium SD302]|nr:hypothetical protein CEQ90_02195 [Lewinellaceae bacterium SD302]
MKDKRPIGFYVHHHGSGHATRVRQLASYWMGKRPVHVLTSAPRFFSGWKGGRVHILPPDVSPDRDPRTDLRHGRVFHYAPVEVDTLPERMAMISGFISEFRPVAMVVDLSVEVSQFCRLCGVPVITTRLHGKRDDLAHLEAWRNSAALLAPFPARMEDEHTPSWVKDKTIYLGAYSRYDGRPDNLRNPLLRDRMPGRLLAVVINGSGGGAHDLSYWCTVAKRHDHWQWWLLGECLERAEAEFPGNLSIYGHQLDTYPFLRAADVVIGSGGTNTVFEIGAAEKPFCCLPEERPFEEQLYKAKALARLGLATVCTERPKLEEWAAILEKTRHLDPNGWRKIRRSNGLEFAYQQLENTFTLKSFKNE